MCIHACSNYYTFQNTNIYQTPPHIFTNSNTFSGKLNLGNKSLLQKILNFRKNFNFEIYITIPKTTALIQNYNILLR